MKKEIDKTEKILWKNGYAWKRDLGGISIGKAVFVISSQEEDKE